MQTFRTIPQYNGYEVSQDGITVRRISNQKECKQAFQKIKGKSTGYLYCTLIFNHEGFYIGLPKRIAVHRLVAFAWLESPQDGQVWVNHKDGNKSNNHKDNLEWSTIKENIQHAYNTGLHPIVSGQDHWRHGTKASKETRKVMSDKKKGIKHPKFKGYYFVNFKRYESALQASEATKIHYKKILRYCKDPRKRLEGFYFLPVNS